MSLTLDQKRAYNKMKHELEPWRNVIVHLDSVLTWEKNYYPAIICAAISVFFLSLWALDLSTVTMLSLAGFIVTLIDYGYPSVSRFLTSADNWNGNKEQQYERVCSQLCQIKATFGTFYDFVFNSKERKSTLFVILMSAALLALAYIGAVFNNLFLMYIVVLSMAMYPGVQQKNIYKLIKEGFGCILKSKVNQFEKAKKEE